ncbi:hypothetical protein HDV57DRAFT_38965 [Trichoderma longibrachiatum]|uniref:Uncharacterized protein n=1 Tax=Trichoderma longibrachiatum ATCC 18648 TaxID=983965 RepID=A0A2T4CHM1_TRILO|nr:hypothetical protein M440DRAFT_1005928 [Trichoderma longibrachiatum ATCC 18648]
MQPHPLALLPSASPLRRSPASSLSTRPPSCIIITTAVLSPSTYSYLPASPSCRPAASYRYVSLRRLPGPDSVPRRVHASRRRGHPCQSMPCHALLGGEMVVMANQGGDGWRTSWPLKWELAHARDPPPLMPALRILYFAFLTPPANLLTYLPTYYYLTDRPSVSPPEPSTLFITLPEIVGRESWLRCSRPLLLLVHHDTHHHHHHRRRRKPIIDTHPIPLVIAAVPRGVRYIDTSQHR